MENEKRTLDLLMKFKHEEENLKAILESQKTIIASIEKELKILNDKLELQEEDRSRIIKQIPSYNEKSYKKYKELLCIDNKIEEILAIIVNLQNDINKYQSYTERINIQIQEKELELKILNEKINNEQ